MLITFHITLRTFSVGDGRATPASFPSVCVALPLSQRPSTMQKTAGLPGIPQPDFYLYSNHPRPALSIPLPPGSKDMLQLDLTSANTQAPDETWRTPASGRPLMDRRVKDGKFWIHPRLYPILFQEGVQSLPRSYLPSLGVWLPTATGLP